MRPSRSPSFNLPLPCPYTLLAQNVIARIEGREEPDKWVILLNHVDAWTFGSQDPNGATAFITEVARTFVALRNATGWRPRCLSFHDRASPGKRAALRRSLLFASVDAEEYGLVGSTEWVEELRVVLGARAVAVLNVDVAIHGKTTFDASAVPLCSKAQFLSTLSD